MCVCVCVCAALFSLLHISHAKLSVSLSLSLSLSLSDFFLVQVEQLRDVLAQMLVFEPANRMAAAAALRHPFFAAERSGKEKE